MEVLAKVWPEWKIVKELGEGSFGKVYELERKDIGGTYRSALKLISIPKDKNEIKEIMTEGMDRKSATQYFRGIVEELVREFALMERLKGNTNIVSYEDHRVIEHEDEIGWDILIRMELLKPLSEYMMSHTMTENEIIKFGIDICRALELCQKNRIIHRDIKPENIFVSEFGDFKLGDFGVARTAEKTMSGMSKKGTYTYMAPEVYRGEAYNNTVDIYSLGIVLYRMLNHYRAPFLPQAPQMITYMDRENSQNRRMCGEKLPRTAEGSDALFAIVEKACAYQPKDRYLSAEEMRKDLEKVAKAAVREEMACEEVGKEDTITDSYKTVMDEMEDDITVAEEINYEKDIFKKEEAVEETVYEAEENAIAVEEKTMIALPKEEETVFIFGERSIEETEEKTEVLSEETVIYREGVEEELKPEKKFFKLGKKIFKAKVKSEKTKPMTDQPEQISEKAKVKLCIGIILGVIASAVYLFVIHDEMRSVTAMRMGEIIIAYIILIGTFFVASKKREKKKSLLIKIAGSVIAIFIMILKLPFLLYMMSFNTDLMFSTIGLVISGSGLLCLTSKKEKKRNIGLIINGVVLLIAIGMSVYWYCFGWVTY